MNEYIELIPKKVFVHKNRWYTKQHLWIESLNSENTLFQLGISQPKVAGRGAVLYINFLIEPGKFISKNEELVEIETQKSITVLTSQIKGIVLEINSQLEENPDIIRKDPYYDGWIVKIKCDESINLNVHFINAKEYVELVKEELGGRIGLELDGGEENE